VKVAAILGAAGGIGAATARLAAARGFRVVAGDLVDPATAVAGLPHAPLAVRADVTDPEAMVRFAAAAQSAGEVAMLVYAAGIVATMPIDRTDWALQRRIMAVNLDGAFFAAGAFAPVFLMQGQGGAAVFISSIAGRRGEAGASAYCASKFGLIGLVESLAAEWAPWACGPARWRQGNVGEGRLRVCVAPQGARP
jgi:NAD(P)-dependent dehydrogenase (short-subunit alcohol dehydrogenase family)